MNRNNYYSRYNSRDLLTEALTNKEFQQEFANALGKNDVTELSSSMQKLAKALSLAAVALKMQKPDDQVTVMKTILRVFEEFIARGSAGQQLTRDIKRGDYGSDQEFSEEEEMQPKMESRNHYRYGSRLSENRRPSYPKRMYPRY